MILYHTIRAFLSACIRLPFLVLGTIFLTLAGICELIVGELRLSYFNPIKTYKIIKENDKKYKFHKWTGRRIK